MHVVERIETLDHVGGTPFATRYAYHHGYFDGVEREFRGFGDGRAVGHRGVRGLRGRDRGRRQHAGRDPANCNQPPVMTRTWFHTGAFGRDASLRLQHEYFAGGHTFRLPLPAGLDARTRDACGR